MSSLVLAVGKGIPAGKCLLCTRAQEGSDIRFRPVSLISLQAGRDLAASASGISYLGKPEADAGPVSPGRLHIAPQFDPEELSLLWQLGIERSDGIEPLCIIDDAELLRLLSADAELAHRLTSREPEKSAMPSPDHVHPVQIDIDTLAHVLTGEELVRQDGPFAISAESTLHRFASDTRELHVITDGAGGYQAFLEGCVHSGVSGHLSDFQEGAFKGGVAVEIQIEDYDDFIFSFHFDPRETVPLEEMNRFLLPDASIAPHVTLTSASIENLGGDRFSVSIEARGGDALAFMQAVRSHYIDLWGGDDNLIGIDKGVFEAFVASNDAPSPDLCGYAILRDNLRRDSAPQAALADEPDASPSM